LASILKNKALKLLYMQPSWHNVMVDKCWLFSDKLNRKHRSSITFVLFTNVYFTCQIIRIVTVDLKTVSMIFFSHAIFLCYITAAFRSTNGVLSLLSFNPSFLTVSHLFFFSLFHIILDNTRWTK
jgi:hypothetical protein